MATRTKPLKKRKKPVKGINKSALTKKESLKGIKKTTSVKKKKVSAKKTVIKKQTKFRKAHSQVSLQVPGAFPSVRAIFVIFAFAFFLCSLVISYQATFASLDRSANKQLHFAFPTPANMQHSEYVLPEIPLADATDSAQPVLSKQPEASASSTPTLQPTNEPSPTAANDFCLYVPILLYHHIQPIPEATQLGHAQLTVDSSFFEEQLAYLNANNYHTVSVEELVHALLSHQTLPDKTIVLTMDDGYDDMYNYAFPLLKKYHEVGNFMIPSGLIGNPGYMTWQQLKEISDTPDMYVYNHTWSHAALGDGASRDKIEYEITEANSELESNLGKNIDIFTYPYGSFSPLVIQVLKEHGFIAALSTIEGRNQCVSTIMQLPRNHVGNAPLSAYGL